MKVLFGAMLLLWIVYLFAAIFAGVDLSAIWR